jgi:hypothetical protein
MDMKGTPQHTLSLETQDKPGDRLKTKLIFSFFSKAGEEIFCELFYWV